MASSRILEMDFSTELNQTHRMRVYDAKTTLTGAEITTAMNSIDRKSVV